MEENRFLGDDIEMWYCRRILNISWTEKRRIPAEIGGSRPCLLKLGKR